MASVDPIEDNITFATNTDASFPILSDTDKSMTRAYGVLSGMGFANRWTYYIDPDGVIVKIDKAVKVQTAGKDLLANLIELGVPEA